MKKPYKKPKKHEQYLSSNPHGHYAARATPAKSPSGIRYNIPTGSNERWIDSRKIILYSEHDRHHHIYNRAGINQKNDIVRKHFQREISMFGDILDNLF